MKLFAAIVAISITQLSIARADGSIFIQETQATQDFCVYRDQVYSFGSIICIGPSHAIRCDGPEPPSDKRQFRTSHFTLLDSSSSNNPYSDVKIGDACPAAK